ncbi:OBP3-responsive protein 4 (ORG4) [Wolffia australiana]
MASPRGGRSSDGAVLGEDEPPSFDDLYRVNVFPSELFFKFRKQVRGIRLGLNLEFYNYEVNDYHAKLVVKPLGDERRWKFVYEPIQGEFRVLSKKIPIARYLNLQVGVGHNYYLNAIGWKWKLSTCLGGDGVSQIRNKASFGLFPGLDVRIGWRAEYVLPEVNGSVGAGEPIFNMSYGRLHASIDKVETIFTHES